MKVKLYYGMLMETHSNFFGWDWFTTPVRIVFFASRSAYILDSRPSSVSRDAKSNVKILEMFPNRPTWWSWRVSCRDSGAVRVGRKGRRRICTRVALIVSKESIALNDGGGTVTTLENELMNWVCCYADCEKLDRDAFREQGPRKEIQRATQRNPMPNGSAIAPDYIWSIFLRPHLVKSR